MIHSAITRLSVPGAALLFLAGGPAARAGFEPGPEILVGKDKFMRPVGLASFSDDSLFVLDGGSPCPDCRTPAALATCP
ncbi:MAG: hypothetical protein ABSH53_01440 [Holophaga sp.]